MLVNTHTTVAGAAAVPTTTTAAGAPAAAQVTPTTTTPPPAAAAPTTTPAKDTTSNTTPAPAPEPETTTTQQAPGNMGAAGGGGGDPQATESGAPDNVFTATKGSGGVLDYGSCIEFESQCNTLCTHGIYSMDCVTGGICLCYEDDPGASSDAADEVADGQNADDSDNPASRLSAYLPLPALAAALAAFI
ncbi:hypothetical protein GGF46_004188 [Coemansia sp. RSA 552]|nr:hypothetical protein GGF46_004188 [Coemansia sp. RSA 552]